MSALDHAKAVRKGAPFCHLFDFSESSACICWSQVPGATSYCVQIRELLPDGEKGFPQWKTLSSTVKGQRVRKNKLEADKAYEFRVAPPRRVRSRARAARPRR